MSIDEQIFDVIIVGGGISGLVAAFEIHRTKKNWALLEARPFVGGRVENDYKGNGIDLGGAWIWPRHQPKIVSLIDSLGVKTFVQPDDPSSTRIQGGAADIVKKLANKLPSERIKVASPVVACIQAAPEECSKRSSKPFVTLEVASGEKIRGRRVVFAAPPKTLSMRVKFNPPLQHTKNRAMSRSQTWMAGVTKVALVYRERVWSLQESNMGFRPGPNQPAFQVYDGSPGDKSIFVLTFFALAPASKKSGDDAVLARQCAEQMAQALSFMGPESSQKLADYVEFYVKRWPLEEYISEDPNPRTVNPHPTPTRELATNAWDDMLLFAGTETDLSSPGVMEGAVGSALRVASDLKDLWESEAS